VSYDGAYDAGSAAKPIDKEFLGRRSLNVISTLPDPSGLYVLTPQGNLGVYLSPNTDNNKFSLDIELSTKLFEHVAGFLKSYLANPDGSSARVAIIYNSVEKKPWGHATFYMEESVVRDVYPVAGLLVGSVSNTLTTFQKRNREKSIYRGLETLLAHKADSNLAIYCPVLFDRNTTLDCYLSALDRGVQEGDRNTPVLEVLNLVATVPVLARNSPAILDLREKLHAVLIKSHMRKESGLAVADSETWKAPTVEWKGRASASADVTKKVPDFTRLHVTDRHTDIERWLEQPPRVIDPMALRGFFNFRELTDHSLSQVAEQCPVYRAPAGTRLLERGASDKWNLFLVSGSLLMQPLDSAPLLIESGTESAASPVSFLKPRKYQVVAKTQVNFLWIPDALLHSLAVGAG
jgi:hypothetical protein